MMDQEQISSMVVEISTKLDALIDAFNKVSNGIGFPRCAKREEQITNLATRIGKLEANQTWLVRTLALIILGYIVKVAVTGTP